MAGFVYDDGGRAASKIIGPRRNRDCVARSIAIATQIPYQRIWQEISEIGQLERSSTQRGGHKSSAESGVYKPTIRRYLASIGWKWTPTMFIGQGCKVHLKADELPKGRLIVQLSRHLTAVIDGVVHDTHDPRRGGTRCVYGYWQQGKIR